MSKPKIAWCHRANDNYYTDEEMAENHERIKAAYIKFVEFSAYQKVIEALKLLATLEMDLDLIPIECLGLVRRARETLRELGEIE